MANPLLKMTLMLLSLLSAMLVGQNLLGTEHSSGSHATKDVPSKVTAHVNTKTATYHQPAQLSVNAKDLRPDTINVPSSLTQYHAEARSQREQSYINQNASNESSIPAETASNQQVQRSKKSQRSLSFHYLDILEWMFAGRGEKAKRHQLQSPSTLHAW